MARKKIIKPISDISNKKINAGCLKIFTFLKLLYEDNATYENVIEIFKDEIKIEQKSNNTQVVLNKYVNTLKIFGIKIVKEKGKYRLLSSLYTMDVTYDDLKAISILMASIKNFPDTNLSEEVMKLINMFAARLNNEDRQTLSLLATNNNYNFSFYYKDWREQIKQCTKLCKDNSLLKIVYFDKEQDVSIKCTAKEVLYDSKSALLKVYILSEKRYADIPIPNIISVDVEPSLTTAAEKSQTVIFMLKGRLAQTYHLREDYERQIDYNNDTGTRVYANTGEPFDSLLSRLMRYQDNCEIISPKSLKNEMLNLINQTLDNYNETEQVKEKPKKKDSKSLKHKDIIE